jgi:hypothetical protein
MASDEDKLKADLYWKMYNEHAMQARHHEILRGTISTLLVTVCAGIVSIYNVNQGNVGTKYHFYIGLMLIALGTLGALLSYKHYERNRLHVSTLREFRNEIDEILGPLGGSIGVPNRRGRDNHNGEYPYSSKWLRVHYLWASVFIFIIGTGAMIAWSHATP